MESVHYTRSKSRRTSLVSDTPSDVEPDDAAPETAISGPVRLPVTAAGELGSMSLQLAEPPSAPATVEGEGGGSVSDRSFRAGVSLSAPGGQTDPQFGPTSFTPIVTELMQNQAANQYEHKQVLSDSGVPGCPPPDAAVVGERPTSSAARRPSTPRPRATSSNLTKAPFSYLLF